MGWTRLDGEPAVGKFFFPALNGAAAVFGSPPPGAPTLVIQAGGTIPIGPVSYRIAALDVNGTTVAGTEATGTTTSGQQQVQLTWNLTPKAQQYQIYGRTTGAELLLTTLTANAYTLGGTQTFVDTGALTPAGALPSASTSQKDKRIVYDIIVTNNQASNPVDVMIFDDGVQVGSMRVVVAAPTGYWSAIGGEGGIGMTNLSIVTSVAADVTVLTNE